MTVTLNAYNVVAVRCAAEYLEMYESIENGNLVYKIEVFLNSSVLRSWKDSIIVLQSTKLCNPWSEEVKIVERCLESIASKAVMEPAKVDWSFTRKNNNGGPVPREWWIEDLCDLDIDLYKRVISTIKSKEKVSLDVIGEALEAYAIKNIFNFNLEIDDFDVCRFKSLLETLIWLLPNEKQSCSCGFLIKLLKSLISVESDKEKKELVRRIGEKLEEATVHDLLIFEIDIVETLIDEFLTEINVTEDSKAMVAKLIDGYLTEISRIDSSLSPLKFLEIAEKVSKLPRLSHDGVYRAIDMFLKEHSGVTKSEKKLICRLIDCRKLSPEACAHSVQNERLPLRVVVQILFFEQIRSTGKPSGQQSGSEGSSKANTEEECESVAAMEESKTSSEKVKANKGIVISKVFSKLWSKERDGGDVSSSDTSESPGSATTVDDKSTPSTRRRRSSS